MLIDFLGDFCSKIINNFTSDHHPITLQWRNVGIRKGLPFKFNRTWLEDPNFNQLIQDCGKYYPTSHMPSPSQNLLNKMDSLKKEVKPY